jgi:hypothetical protein
MIKTLLIISILSELFLVVLAFSPVFINKRSAAQALVEWHKNPSPENETIWLRESAALRREHLTVEIIIYCLLALNTWGMITLIKRVRRNSKIAIE